MDVERSRGRRRSVAVGAGLLAASLAVALSGCFSLLHAGQAIVAPESGSGRATATDSPSTPSAPTDPHAAIRASAANVVVPVGTHAGDGTVSTRDGAVTGFVAVVTTPHQGYRVRVTSYGALSPAQLRVYASPVEVDPKQSCFLNGPTQRDLGLLPRGRVEAISLSTDASAFLRGDPSFLKGLVFVDPNRASISCGFVVVATATLVWRLPDMNPGLEAVDGGVRENAGGVVEGTTAPPVAYTARGGDTAAGIASRFGMTADNLRWLNPTLRLAPVRQDERINLDPDSR